MVFTVNAVCKSGRAVSLAIHRRRCSRRSVQPAQPTEPARGRGQQPTLFVPWKPSRVVVYAISVRGVRWQELLFSKSSWQKHHNRFDRSRVRTVLCGLLSRLLVGCALIGT